MRQGMIVLGVLGLVGFAGPRGAGESASAAPPLAPVVAQEPAEAPDFKQHVLPIFNAKCIRCHGAMKKGGKLDMRTIEALLAGGDSGPAFKPGDAAMSLLIELIHYNEMPPKKEEPRVSKEELELLRKWINGWKP